MRHMITRLDSEDLPFLYGWLWDRTRAVRKDLRTQAVDKPDEIAIYLECFEQCARLLLICLHHMSGITSQDYDHQQDVEQLMQTHTSLKERYNDNRSAKIVSANEAEFQAYRLILSVHTNDSLIEHEVQNLPENLRRNGRVKTALRIYQAGKAVLHKRSRKLIEARQNWRDFWVLIQSPAVSYLMACASEILFNQVRHTVLDTLFRAYRQGTPTRPVKMEDWTLSELLHVLGFDTNKQVVEFCQAYGFTFGTNAAGEHFLDINSLPYSTGTLQDPAEMTPQFFSQFVESKRHRRNLSAVIQGMSVKAALSKGLVVESERAIGMEAEQDSDEDSLFIPDKSAAKQVGFAAANNGISGLQNGPAASAGAPNLNPFASPFQPTTTPISAFNTGVATPPNPFLTGAKPPIASTPPFGTPTGPSFAPSDNGKTANTIAVPKSSPFGTPSGPSFKPIGTTAEPPKSNFGLPSFAQQGNPLVSKPTTTTSPATGQTVQPGLFDASKNGIVFNSAPTGTSPFSSFKSESPFAPAATTPVTTTAKASEESTSQSQSPFSLPGPATTEDKPNSASNGYNFFQKAPSSTAPVLPSSSGSTSNPKGLPDFKLASPTTSQASSSTPTAFPSFSQGPIGPGTNQQSLTSQEEDAQRAQREQKEREVKEAQELAARKAKEEEVQRRAREALQRTRREKEERERQAQQTQLAQQQQREERIRQQREATLTAIAEDLVKDPVDGLIQQYIDNQIGHIYYEVAPRIRWERLTRIADERYHTKQVARARYYFARWVAMTHKKKRNSKARERRRWLKQNAAALLALKNEASINGTNRIAAVENQPTPTIVDQPKSSQKSANQTETKAKTTPAMFKKPEAPASAALRVQKVSKPTTIAMRPPPSTNKSRHTKAASQGSNMILYKNHNAPIDRTQTDWFKLRAAGIDPSKHRKRSFGSASDDEEPEDADRKRLRRSTSSVIPTPPTHRTSLPPPTTDEERLARFRAVQDALGTPSTPIAIQNTRPVNETASLIAKARQFTSASKGSSSNMQPEFSRSVPDLNYRSSNGSLSAFGNSMGTSASKDRPAYWARQSRFVPQHLYGKGSEAVLEYRRQFRTSTGSSASASVEPQENLGPLQLSSPIPIQEPYAPEQFLEEFDSEDISGTGDDEGEGMEGDDEEMFEYEDEEEEEEDEEEEEEEDVDYGAYTNMEYDQSEQNAQHLSGTTQNAPIELSDSD
jgi:hypothetical protein